MKTIDDLLIDLHSTELYLSHFAARPETSYTSYEQSLIEFVRAWYTVKNNRNPEEFIPDMAA
jgi:hypothetical protein